MVGVVRISCKLADCGLFLVIDIISECQSTCRVANTGILLFQALYRTTSTQLEDTGA